MDGSAPAPQRPGRRPAAGWWCAGGPVRAVRRPAARSAALLRTLVGEHPERLVHVHEVPARTAAHADWPDWVDPTLLGALLGSGIERPWSHQVEVAEAAHAGRARRRQRPAPPRARASATSCRSSATSSREPPPRTVAARRRSTSSPTKALAADQLSRVARPRAARRPARRPTTATRPTDERRWIRDHANLVLTNPDLVHHSLLPRHDRWSSFLRALRYVVIDECHVYKGVFGAHIAAVLRRLRRVAARYKASPTFVFASATVAEPGSTRAAFSVCRSAAVTRGRLASGAHDVRPLGASARASATTASRAGSAPSPRPATCSPAASRQVQTVAFARSRAGVEVVASSPEDRVSR